MTPTDIILSDADGLPLDVAGEQGTITVTAVTQAPEVQIAVLKNPGRPRTLQILINVIRGSGNLPTVTADGAAVTMSALSGSRFLGTYAAANDAASVTITASDTNTQGPGSNQVTITSSLLRARRPMRTNHLLVLTLVAVDRARRVRRRRRRR